MTTKEKYNKNNYMFKLGKINSGYRFMIAALTLLSIASCNELDSSRSYQFKYDHIKKAGAILYTIDSRISEVRADACYAYWSSDKTDCYVDDSRRIIFGYKTQMIGQRVSMNEVYEITVELPGCIESGDVVKKLEDEISLCPLHELDQIKRYDWGTGSRFSWTHFNVNLGEKGMWNSPGGDYYTLCQKPKVNMGKRNYSSCITNANLKFDVSSSLVSYFMLNSDAKSIGFILKNSSQTPLMIKPNAASSNSVLFEWLELSNK